MSVAVMSEVWKRAIETVPKMILLKLADHANDDGGSIYPGPDSLRKAAGLADPKTVKRRLREFRELGVLVDTEEKAKVGRVWRKVFRLDVRALARHFPVLPKQPGEDVAVPSLTALASAEKARRAAAGEADPGADEEADEESVAEAGEAVSRGGSEPPREGAGHEGAEDADEGAGEAATRGLGSPPNHHVTIKEASRARAGARDGDPDGPSREPGPPSLAAEWRALLPRIVAAVDASNPHDRSRTGYVRHVTEDAFVTARREGWWHPGPFGKRYGRLRPAVFLRLAVADPRALHDFGRKWRQAIHEATGYVIRPKLDPRAFAAKARREEREKAERGAAKVAAKPGKARRASA